MHHKRRRPKNRRAGCLLCKPHKANRIKGRRGSASANTRRSAEAFRTAIGELACRPPAAFTH
jgi:hypothetical protein